MMMSAPTTENAASGNAQQGAEALTLLDALARAPAAAALVVRALERAGDRKALRLAHPQLRDAVGEATTRLETIVRDGAAAPRPPTPRRWPRLEELTLRSPGLAALEALGSETWGRLRTLSIGYQRVDVSPSALDEPCTRALVAALRRVPALRALDLREVALADDAAAALFRASSAEDAPQLRLLAVTRAGLTPAAARMIAASGWRLEELCLRSNPELGAAGLAALVAAPSFALRRLTLIVCSLDMAAILAVANAPWPLEELDLSCNNLSADAAGPALAALSRHRGLRRLDVNYCHLNAASFKALVEAAWPALISLCAIGAEMAFAGPHALGAAAFAGCPALEELDLSFVDLGEAGAALLASRCWSRLRKLNLRFTQLGRAGVAALARGAWPALSYLDLEEIGLSAPLALEEARRWAPKLDTLRQ